MSAELAKKLGYQFKDASLLKTALTHRSAATPNNERLEFLGDAIVNLLMAEALYEKFTFAQEGDLSRFRATLINRDTLGELGKHFDLGRYLILGAGELKSGGTERFSIISCTMEAVIGAIYLDSGYEATRATVLKWYAPLLKELKNAKSHKDPKTQLQEFLQRKHLELPIYTVVSIEGEAHQQQFVMSCEVNGATKIFGKGSSRRRAEQDAASQMLEQLVGMHKHAK